MIQKKHNADWLTVADAAKRLGVSPMRVRQFLNGRGSSPRMIGENLGGMWVVSRGEVERFRKIPRPVGRPRKV